jgi:hypothetical protein
VVVVEIGPYEALLEGPERPVDIADDKCSTHLTFKPIKNPFGKKLRLIAKICAIFGVFKTVKA